MSLSFSRLNFNSSKMLFLVGMTRDAKIVDCQIFYALTFIIISFRYRILVIKVRQLSLLEKLSGTQDHNTKVTENSVIHIQ
jgi:hypothetical protein